MQAPQGKTWGVERQAKAKDVIRVFWKAMKPYWLMLFFIVVTISIASVLQVYVPVLYKDFFNILADVSGTPASKTAVAPNLVGIVILILVLNLIIWFLNRAATVIQNFFQAKAIAKLKQDAFEYMFQHSYSFFANNFTGSLTQRVNRFGRAFDTLADQVIWTILPIGINVIGIVIVLWYVKPIISIIVFVWVVGFFLFNYLFSLWKVKYDIRTAEIDSKATGLLSDDITNHNAVQLFTSYPYEVKNYKDVTDEQARATTLGWNLSAVIDSVQLGFVVIVEFLLFYISIHYWVMGLFTIGTFVLIQVYLIGLGARLWNFARLIRNIYESFADAKEMLDIMLMPHEIKDAPAAKKLIVTKGDIEFKNLTFNFNENRRVLDGINLRIESGEKVALVGPSGAGKSTFVRLILRLYEAGSGAILIDGQDIAKITQESLRQNVSFVPQEPILFHRSLKDNIRYGQRNATDDEVFIAARLAHCDEFIKDLPFGYDTYVGERGIKLSGGERQRIAIARAILKNAPILILDEATSSLDSESEHLIQDALDTLMRGKTVIVIAHRLSTIRKMNRIIVLENGKIKEQGTHEELLGLPGSLYQKLWNLQAGGFIADVDENIDT
jgi:ATP-binding cassette subfamily B protein